MFLLSLLRLETWFTCLHSLGDTLIPQREKAKQENLLLSLSLFLSLSLPFFLSFFLSLSPRRHYQTKNQEGNQATNPTMCVCNRIYTRVWASQPAVFKTTALIVCPYALLHATRASEREKESDVSLKKRESSLERKESVRASRETPGKLRGATKGNT